MLKWVQSGKVLVFILVCLMVWYYGTCYLINFTGMHFHQRTGVLYFINVAKTGYATLDRYDTYSGARKTLLRNLINPVKFIIDEDAR